MRTYSKQALQNRRDILEDGIVLGHVFFQFDEQVTDFILVENEVNEREWRYQAPECVPDDCRFLSLLWRDCAFAS